MITLHQFHPAFNLPNGSPPCMKVETVLRMAKIPYENAYADNPGKGPKKKFPYVTLEDGSELADSSFIVDYLNKTYQLDKNLSEQQQAVGLAIQRMLEDHLYWCAVYMRWLIPENRNKVLEEFFAETPKLVRNIIGYQYRKYVKDCLYKQGTGRHTYKEITHLGVQDIHALNVLLDENAYLLGDTPSYFDATAHAYVANLIEPKLNCPLCDYAKQQKNLVAYHQRMMERYYSASKINPCEGKSK